MSFQLDELNKIKLISRTPRPFGFLILMRSIEHSLRHVRRSMLEVRLFNVHWFLGLIEFIGPVKSSALLIFDEFNAKSLLGYWSLLSSLCLLSLLSSLFALKLSSCVPCSKLHALFGLSGLLSFLSLFEFSSLARRFDVGQPFVSRSRSKLLAAFPRSKLRAPLAPCSFQLYAPSSKLPAALSPLLALSSYALCSKLFALSSLPYHNHPIPPYLASKPIARLVRPWMRMQTHRLPLFL